MWIVSQDRKTVIYTFKVYADGNKLVAFNDFEYCTVGTYESEETAKEELKKLTHCLYEGGKVYEVN